MTGYNPSPTNNGVINVGSASAFNVDLIAQQQSSDLESPDPPRSDNPELITDPPEESAFIDNGTIAIDAGGSACSDSNDPDKELDTYAADLFVNKPHHRHLRCRRRQDELLRRGPSDRWRREHRRRHVHRSEPDDRRASDEAERTRRFNSTRKRRQAPPNQCQCSIGAIDITGTNGVLSLTDNQVVLNQALPPQILSYAGNFAAPVLHFSAGDRLRFTSASSV